MSLRRALRLAFVLSLCTLAAVATLAWRSARHVVEADRWVRESSAILHALQDLYTEVLETESARRAFVIGGEETRREWCLFHLEATGRRLEALRVAVGPERRSELDPLAAAVAEKSAHTRAALASPGAEPPDAVLRHGTALRERIRNLVGEASEREQRTLAARLADAARSGRRTMAIVLATGILAVALTALGLWYAHGAMNARERAEEELRRLEALLEATPDIVGIALPDGSPVWLNRAGREAMGLVGARNRPGCRVFEFFPEWASAKMQVEGIPAAIAHGHWTGETAVRAADGSEIPCSQVILCHRDARGEVAYLSAILRDIRERKEVDRLKDEFVATVNHELKTPLTAIQGAVTLLLDGGAGEIPEKARRFLDMALRNSNRLVRLVSDIGDVERIEAGAIDFVLRPLELGGVIAQVVETATTTSGSVRIVFDACSRGAWVLGDADRLAQVVTNLLSNAVKFSPEEGRVDVLLERRDGAIRVSVVDHGRGIPPEFRKRIFGRFAQAESADRREKGGTGLGLAISKAIVERHGGRIDYVSEPGRETTFFFEIPESPLPA